MDFLIEKIIVDEKVVNDKLTQRILRNFPQIPSEIVTEETLNAQANRFSFTEGKRILAVTKQEGEMVKPCPGTLPPYICCQYTVINQTTQCPMDCAYCILQAYLKNPFITIYTNLADIFQSIDKLLEIQPWRFFRFGTGELSDSLALDSLTSLSRDYAKFFSTKRNTLIEFKTKTDSIELLLDSPTKNVVVSWSLNPQIVADREEALSANIKDRLKAARKCQDKGFLIGFHFDPILWVPDWESLYHELIQELFSWVDGSGIVWISMGSLRYPPILKEIVQERFPRSKIVYEEMIRGLDGKMRYPRPLRVEMYKKIYGWLKEKAPDLFIYFCMESPVVWDQVMGTHPNSNNELDFWFARSLRERFPSLNMDTPQYERYEEEACTIDLLGKK